MGFVVWGGFAFGGLLLGCHWGRSFWDVYLYVYFFVVSCF